MGHGDGGLRTTGLWTLKHIAWVVGSMHKQWHFWQLCPQPLLLKCTVLSPLLWHETYPYCWPEQQLQPHPWSMMMVIIVPVILMHPRYWATPALPSLQLSQPGLCLLSQENMLAFFLGSWIHHSWTLITSMALLLSEHCLQISAVCTPEPKGIP